MDDSLVQQRSLATLQAAAAPRASIRRQLDMLLAVATLPAAVMAAAVLFTDANGAAGFTLSALLRSTTGLAIALLLICSWALSLWLARRLAASFPFQDATSVLLRPEDHRQTKEPEAAGCSAMHLQALQHQANHDELTGLANRRLFDASLRQRLALCSESGARFALLYIDIDGFKHINDAHGHSVGDELLCLFAARLRTGLREADVVARLGGDEFAVILAHACATETLGIADALIERLSRPYQLGTRMLRVSASIGLAACAQPGSSGPALLAAADAAMYQAKQSGKRCHVTSGLAPL